MELTNIFLNITKRLDQLDQQRELLIKGSREMVRNCSVAIKSIHRGEFEVYEQKIEEIKVPESPSNVTFGGKDNKTLFITARSSLYAVEMSVKGAATRVWPAKAKPNGR